MVGRRCVHAALADLIAYATRIWRRPFASYTPSSNPPDVNAAIVLMIIAAAVGALNAQAAKSLLPVTVDADGIGRFGQDTEAAVYFCCLEALQNIAKYARASSAHICLQAQNGTLRLTVSDDGIGYDARHTPMGSGLRNMSGRLAALGGRLEIQSAPRQGTTIMAELPGTSVSDQHRHLDDVTST
jgi:signal transduction histidine kinase